MFLQKAAIGYGDEGLGMIAEVVKVLHVHGIKSVVCLHFRVYNKGEGMEIRTHLRNTLEAVDSLKARYDKNVKELLADIQVLARIVKHTVVEVDNLSIEQIMACIDHDSICIGMVPVEPGLTNMGRVDSVQTEDAVPNEGYVTYDIRFMLIVVELELEIIINVEAQRSMAYSTLGYHLENRMVFYLSRLISSQKGINFVNSEYDKIKKVYSIWICMDADDDGDSISRISLKQDTLFGMPYDFTELDKMCGMVIRIRNSRNVTESRNRLIAMLEDVLSREDSDVKKRKLEEKYAMKMTLELEGRINRMCNLSDVVVERGIELGIQQGMQRGIKGLVDILRDMGTPKEVIVQKIMEKFSMTEEKAREFVE